MGQPAAKKARGEGDGIVPTIREFLPWHVIEKKMAAPAEARASQASQDVAPDSGVYASGQHAAAVIAANQNAEAAPPGEPVVPTDSGGLSYQVYTLKDLEARGVAADLSVNSTRMSMVMTAPKPNAWADVARAAVVVVRIAKTWVTAPSPRPPAKDAFRAPIVALTYELRQAVKTIDWKKVGTYAALSVGVFLFLLFAVVTVAELTDDLKPARVSSTQTGDSYTSAIVAAQPSVAARPVVAPPPPPAPASTGDGLEVSADPTPAPPAPAPVAKTPAKKKGAAKKKPRTGEVFTP